MALPARLWLPSGRRLQKNCSGGESAPISSHRTRKWAIWSKKPQSKRRHYFAGKGREPLLPDEANEFRRESRGLVSESLRRRPLPWPIQRRESLRNRPRPGRELPSRRQTEQFEL